MITSRLPAAFLVATLAGVSAVIIGVAGGLASAQQEAGAVETCTGDTIELNGYEKRTLDLHNETRTSYGLQPLCVHPALTEAARAHSQDMLDGGYFSHDSPDGESTEERLMRSGYTPDGYSYWTYGENLAWGSGALAEPESRFDEWMNSTEHRDNILREDLSEIGVGAVTDDYGEVTMYTVDFGTRY